MDDMVAVRDEDKCWVDISVWALALQKPPVHYLLPLMVSKQARIPAVDLLTVCHSGTLSPVRQSAYLITYLAASVSLSVCLSVRPSVCLSVLPVSSGE